MTTRLSAPQPLEPTHRTERFHCGEPSLDDWLRRRAYGNQLSGASRTFVVVDALQQVAGYYALATGAVSHQEATGRIRRNMPEPIPVLVLGRLAISHEFQGQRLGTALLQDAVRRSWVVSQNAGVRALLVHALNASAQEFYTQFGFDPSPSDPRTLMLRLSSGGLSP
jgi:GNAT superfamily N-acetyltransferase